jgi:hypothetical protein
VENAAKALTHIAQTRKIAGDFEALSHPELQNSRPDSNRRFIIIEPFPFLRSRLESSANGKRRQHSGR